MNVTSLRRVGVAWLAVGIALLVWWVAATGSNSSARDRYHNKQQQQAKLEHFYRVIDGSAEDDTGGMLNKLGRDLRVLKTPGAVYEFRGDSNRYGGVSGELGFDPFNGVNCSECGPLDIDIARDVVAVKQGHLASVLSRLKVQKPGSGGGPPSVLWLLWILSLPLASAGLWAITDRSRKRRYRDMPEEMRLIHKLDQALEGTFENPQDRYDLQHTRERLMQEIETRVTYGQRAKQRMRLNDLKQEAINSLDAIEQGNRALQQ